MERNKENTLIFINQKCPHLTNSERAMLNYIASFPNGINKKLKLIALDLGTSERSIQRSVIGLLKYGLITRSYGLFKIITYKLVIKV